MATPEKHGLAKQFTRLIVLSGLASFLLLGFLQVVLNKSLRFLSLIHISEPTRP